MNIPAVFAAGAHAPSQQIQSLTQHARGQRPSLNDVDIDTTGATSPPVPSGKPGTKIDIRA